MLDEQTRRNEELLAANTECAGMIAENATRERQDLVPAYGEEQFAKFRERWGLPDEARPAPEPAKLQAPAEVIARARSAATVAEFTGDVDAVWLIARKRRLAIDALLVAVEAAPDHDYADDARLREEKVVPEVIAPVILHDDEGWGLSLAGSNPPIEHFIACASEDDARRLRDALLACVEAKPAKLPVPAEVLAALEAVTQPGGGLPQSIRESSHYSWQLALARRDAICKVLPYLAVVEAAPKVNCPLCGPEADELEARHEARLAYERGRVNQFLAEARAKGDTIRELQARIAALEAGKPTVPAGVLEKVTHARRCYTHTLTTTEEAARLLDGAMDAVLCCITTAEAPAPLMVSPRDQTLCELYTEEREQHETAEIAWAALCGKIVAWYELELAGEIDPAPDARTPVPEGLYKRIEARANGDNPVNEDWELVYEVFPHLRPAPAEEDSTVECPTCDGRGWVEVQGADTFDPPMQDACGECGGTGRVEAEDDAAEEPAPAPGSGSLYRKRPLVVRAVRCCERREIETLEGVMIADAGDWIITGVTGERYPCKPDIFAATYERVAAEAEAEDDDERLTEEWAGGTGLFPAESCAAEGCDGAVMGCHADVYLCAHHADYMQQCMELRRKMFAACEAAPAEQRLTEGEWTARTVAFIEFVSETLQLTPQTIRLQVADDGVSATIPSVMLADEQTGSGPTFRDAVAAVHKACLPAEDPAPDDDAPAPTPDFATMSPEDLRAWLDERGYVQESHWETGHGASLYRQGGKKLHEVMCSYHNREAALLALCEKVAAEEATR